MTSCTANPNNLGRNFLFTECRQHFSAPATSVLQKFNLDSLRELSEDCFNAYNFRLKEIDEEVNRVGVAEYRFANDVIIKSVLEYDPLNFSFSISEDPSLHFFVRFPKGVSVSIETYIDLVDGSDTYLQVRKNNRPVYSINSTLEDCVEEMRSVLSKEISHNATLFV